VAPAIPLGRASCDCEAVSTAGTAAHTTPTHTCRRQQRRERRAACVASRRFRAMRACRRDDGQLYSSRTVSSEARDGKRQALSVCPRSRKPKGRDATASADRTPESRGGFFVLPGRAAPGAAHRACVHTQRSRHQCVVVDAKATGGAEGERCLRPCMRASTSNSWSFRTHKADGINGCVLLPALTVVQVRSSWCER
jgi:hypothetical protein